MSADNFPTVTPLLQPWGDDLARMVASLVQFRPDLAARMMLLPARGLHAIAIALHAAKAANERVESIASRISQTHPRELLRQAMPQAIPDLYVLLGRATVPAWTFDAYVSFETLLRSRVASTLTDASEISPDRVESAVTLLHADPIVWHARRAYRHCHERRHLSTVVELLRSLGLLQDLASLPEGAGRKAVYRRVRSDLARAHACGRPFPAVIGWQRVATVADLWEIGGRLKICIRPGQCGSASYALGLISGKHVFLHHSEHDLLAQICHTVADVWTVVQVSGPKNGQADSDVRAALNDALVTAGLRLVPSQPEDALSEVLRESRDRDLFLNDDDDIDVDIAA